MGTSIGTGRVAALALAALCAGASAARAGPDDATEAAAHATAGRPTVGGAAPRSRHETMSRCAHRWRELKREGAAATLTWRTFWAQCSKLP